MRITRTRAALASAVGITALALITTFGVTGAAYRDDANARTDAIAAQVEPPFTPGLSMNARMVDTGLGMSTAGDVYVWGRTDYNMNGGAASPGIGRTPQRIPFPDGTEIRQITGQIYDVNALDADGHVWGWGATDTRNGTSAYRGVEGYPQQIRVGTAWNGTGPLLDDMLSISSTETAGAGIRADGTVWNWGGMLSGYGGNWPTAGATQVPGFPDPTVSGNRPVYIKGAFTNFFVILENGDLYYIGGAIGNSLPPGVGDVGNNAVRLATLDPWMKRNVAAGSPYIVAADGGINMGAALLSDGTVLSWGANSTRTGRGAPATPAIIPTLSNIVSMQFSFTGAVLLDSSNQLWGYGAIDDAGFNPMLPVVLDTDIVQYAAGQGFYLWQKTDGTFWGRGYNPQGAIGLPSVSQTSNRQILFNGDNSLAVVAK